MSPELWGGKLTSALSEACVLLLTLFKVGFYLPTIVLYYVAKAFHDLESKPETSFEPDGLRRDAVTKHRETEGREGKHRKAIHHQPATASRRQPAGHSAEPASPHGPHSPCAPAPAGRQRETEADLVLPAPHSRLPAPHSRLPAEGQLPSPSS